MCRSSTSTVLVTRFVKLGICMFVKLKSITIVSNYNYQHLHSSDGNRSSIIELMLPCLCLFMC